MNIIHILNPLCLAFVFIMYKFISKFTLNDEKVNDDDNKKIIKDGLFIFISGTVVNYVITEYFYTDYLSKIFNVAKSVNTTKAPEVFTDKPGF